MSLPFSEARHSFVYLKFSFFLSEKTCCVPCCAVWSVDINDGFDRSQDNVVIIVNRLLAGRPRNRGSIPGKVKVFLSSSTIQTYPLAHPALYWIGIGSSISGGIAAGS